MHELKQKPLAMDGRILNRPGSGIATYAQALRSAQKAISDQSLLVSDATCTEWPNIDTPISRVRRWTHALSTRLSLGLSVVHNGYYAEDIYRIAHVRFKHTGRMLKLYTKTAPGIMHWSLPVPIMIDGWVNIYTIHDAIPLTHPHLTPMNGQRHRKLLKKIINISDQIVTVSDYARNEIMRATGCAADRISNCSISVARHSANGQNLPHPLVPGRYFLFVGSDDPRKNVARIVAAHQISGATLPLILVGPHDGHVQPRSNIFCLPQQPTEQLRDLIAGARALIFPSLAEGFGLPVIEAMALGTATLTSNTGALEEIAGGAALVVNPESRMAIAQGLLWLEQNDALVLELERRGRQRAKAFSPEHFTNRLRSLYEALLPRLTDMQ